MMTYVSFTRYFTRPFQYRHAEEGSGDLGPLYVDLDGNLNRANVIAEHISRADFVTSEIIIAFIPCD